MAKRFIDTELFNDEWFCELSKDAKLFFIYYITNCDHAGILKLNKKLFEFQTSIKDIDKVIKEMGNKLILIKDSVFFMPGYLKFQYPEFPKSKVKQQEGALKILDNHGITLEIVKSYLTVPKELEYSYVNDNDNVSDNVSVKNNKEGKKNKPTLEECKQYCLERNNGVDADKFFNYYESNGWKVGKNAMKDWKAAIRTWEKNTAEVKQSNQSFKLNNLL